MSTLRWILSLSFAVSLSASAQVQSIRVDPPLMVGMNAVEQIHNLASTAVIAFDIFSQCRNGTGTGESYDSRGGVTPADPIPPSQSVGVLLADPKTCGTGEITGAIFADGHSEGDVSKIKSHWMGSQDALKAILPLVAGVSNGTVTSDHFLSVIDGQLATERRLMTSEAAGYALVLVSVRQLWLRGSNFRMRSGELINIPRPDPAAPPTSKAPGSDSSRAALLLPVLLDWQSRLDRRDEARSEDTALLPPAIAAPVVSSEVPSIIEGAEFKAASLWILPFQNLGSSAAEAIYTRTRCRRSTGAARGNTYDGLQHYFGNELPIPPSGRAGMTLTDATDCEQPIIAAAIFADGHTEGDAEAIAALIQGRNGALKALEQVLPLVQALAEGKSSNAEFREQIQSHLSDGFRSGTPEAYGHYGVMGALLSAWGLTTGPIEFRTAAGKTIQILPLDAEQPPTGLISPKDRVRAMQVVSILEDWHSALERHLSVPSQRNQDR